jgi:hypothetical protein
MRSKTTFRDKHTAFRDAEYAKKETSKAGFFNPLLGNIGWLSSQCIKFLLALASTAILGFGPRRVPQAYY